MAEDKTEAVATAAADATLGHEAVEMAQRAAAPVQEEGIATSRRVSAGGVEARTTENNPAPRLIYSAHFALTRAMKRQCVLAD